MKFNYSLRFKLISIFIISTFIPIVIIMFMFISYYKQQTLNETNLLVNNTLTSISQNVSAYLYELQTLATMLYFDKNVMASLESKDDSGSNDSQQKNNSSKIEASPSALPAYLKLSRSDVRSLILINNNAHSVYVSRNANSQLVSNYNFKETDWYKEAIKKDGASIFIGNHQTEYFTYSSRVRVFSVARVIKHPYLKDKNAVVIADADISALEKMFSDLKFSSSSMSLLLDEKGQVIYSTKQIPENIIKQLNNNYSYINDNKEAYNVFSKTIMLSQWKVVILLSNSEMLKKAQWILNMGILFAFIALVLTFLIFIALSKHIISSFEEMTSVMKKVEKGDLNIKCSIKGNDEISNLKMALNNMITKLNDMIIKEYRLVLSQRNAEYKALQSQIHPHFLYNTLNGFIGLNRIGERETLEKSILNLTGMMRYTLENEDMSTVEQEFDFLKRYCELQKLRFESRMNVNISFSEEVKNFKIPKLLLQPLVENSVLYAVEPSDRQCNISITAYKILKHDNPYLRIRIDDDGPGCEFNKTSGKKGIGISNVQERLRMTYPGSSFSIESAPACGTHINIKIRMGEEA